LIFQGFYAIIFYVLSNRNDYPAFGGEESPSTTEQFTPDYIGGNREVREQCNRKYTAKPCIAQKFQAPNPQAGGQNSNKFQ